MGAGKKRLVVKASGWNRGSIWRRQDQLGRVSLGFQHPLPCHAANLAPQSPRLEDLEGSWKEMTLALNILLKAVRILDLC